MAEKLATEDAVAIANLSAAQTAKLAEFGKGLQQSAVDALSTTLDKKLDIEGSAAKAAPAAGVVSEFSGMFVTIDAELHMEDGSTVPSLLLIGEDEAAALFNISPDSGSEDDYKAKLEEAVQTTITDLSDFLTLSVSVNSGAQLQFGVTGAELRNLAMDPLQLPAGMGGDVLSLRLPVTVDGQPPMDVTYLLPMDALS